MKGRDDMDGTCFPEVLLGQCARLQWLGQSPCMESLFPLSSRGMFWSEEMRLPGFAAALLGACFLSKTTQTSLLGIPDRGRGGCGHPADVLGAPLLGDRLGWAVWGSEVVSYFLPSGS